MGIPPPPIEVGVSCPRHMNPCYNCNERYATCHVSCPKYNDWNDSHIEQRNALNVRKHGYRWTLGKEQYIFSYRVKGRI